MDDDQDFEVGPAGSGIRQANVGPLPDAYNHPREHPEWEMRRDPNNLRAPPVLLMRPAPDPFNLPALPDEPDIDEAGAAALGL